MNNVWLLLDVPNLAYRAAYSTGGLFHGEIPTGVAYGVLRDLLTLQELHQSKRVVFAFDEGRSKRCRLSADYKLCRKPKTQEELDLRHGIGQQIKTLREDYLPALGYRNIFHSEGYEADDVIALVCQQLPIADQAVIVSTDHDFYQLLRQDRVLIWNPRTGKPYTQVSLWKEFGVTPLQWVQVKALAGCPTDGVKGIPGVGEKTAVKYLTGRLPAKHKSYYNIVGNNWLAVANEKLVRLPFEDVGEPPSFPLVEDKVTEQKWQKLLKRLGIKTLGRRLG